MSVRSAARRYRTLLVALAAASLGGAGLLAAPVGTASAQPGSRVCGYAWVMESTHDIVARVAEVSKTTGGDTCWRASESYDHLPNPTEIEQALGHPAPQGDWKRLDFVMSAQDIISGRAITCEDFQRLLVHATDPCLEMNRSDTLFDMHQYLWGSTPDGKGGFAVTVRPI